MILLACATRLECRSALTRVAPSHAPEDPGPVHFRGRAFLPREVGIGPVAAALSMGALLERHREITGILNLGICGSFDTNRAPWARPASPAPRSGRNTACTRAPRTPITLSTTRCSRP